MAFGSGAGRTGRVDPPDDDRAAWRRRQDALSADWLRDDLYPHEVRFYERFIAAENQIWLIPRDANRPRRTTHDFVWLNNDGIRVEVKYGRDYGAFQTKAVPATRRSHMNNADGPKDYFIVDLGFRELSQKIRHQLSEFNLKNPAHQIRRLWVQHRNGLDEVGLK